MNFQIRQSIDRDVFATCKTIVVSCMDECIYDTQHAAIYYQSHRQYDKMMIGLGCNVTTFVEQIKCSTQDVTADRIMQQRGEVDCQLCCEPKTTTQSLLTCCYNVSCLTCLNSMLTHKGMQLPIECPFCRGQNIPSVIVHLESQRVSLLDEMKSPIIMTTRNQIQQLLLRHINDRVLLIDSKDEVNYGYLDDVFLIQSISNWNELLKKKSKKIVAVVSEHIRINHLGDMFDVIILHPSVSRLTVSKMKGMMYYYPFNKHINKTVYELTHTPLLI